MKVSSPEFFPTNSLQKLINMSPHRVYRLLRAKYLQMRYIGNKYSGAFDWNWRKESYNRISLVNKIISEFNDCRYLEIGCASDQLFNSVPCRHKVGVDPASGGNFRGTSDDFFLQNNATFDVIFIDGLHTYKQVRKDIINSLNSVAPGGYIALHDMLPRTWIEEHTPIITEGPWLGDVWKVAYELLATKGLEFKIVKIDYGVGVIKVIDKNAILKDFSEILTDAKFEYLHKNINKLPLVDWSEFNEWINDL